MIFGVDLGTRRAAIACPEVEWVWSVDMATGPGTAQRKRDFPTEIDAGREMGRQARMVLEDEVLGWLGQPDTVFVAERPLVQTGGGANIQTSIGQALSAGAFLTQLPGRVVVLKHSSLWKKAIGVPGNCGKPLVRGWVEAHQPTLAALCDEIEDLFDATCIALGAAVLVQEGQL